MKKRIRIIIAIWVLIAVFNACFSFYKSFYGSRHYADEKTDRNEVVLGDRSCTKIGQEYQGYRARDGYELYQITVEIVNQSTGAYYGILPFAYYADENGVLRANTEDIGSQLYELTECEVIYRNSSDYSSEFGYSGVSVIPGGCSMLHKDIVEIPAGAVYAVIDYSYYFDGEEIISLE